VRKRVVLLLWLTCAKSFGKAAKKSEKLLKGKGDRLLINLFIDVWYLVQVCDILEQFLNALCLQLRVFGLVLERIERKTKHQSISLLLTLIPDKYYLSHQQTNITSAAHRCAYACE
jgi:hypothetical protein